MKFSFCLLTLFLLCCTEDRQIFEYRIPGSYSGLCMIFIYKNKTVNDSNFVQVNNQGLATIAQEDMNRKFLIISSDTKKEIPIIPIGDEDSAAEGSKYIFRLTNENSFGRCVSSDISLISFYVGTKEPTWNGRANTMMTLTTWSL